MFFAPYSFAGEPVKTAQSVNCGGIVAPLQIGTRKASASRLSRFFAAFLLPFSPVFVFFYVF
jgi:hypothetical protein